MKRNFSIGDVVAGKKNERYAVTNEKMAEGTVVAVDTDNNTFTVSVVKHSDTYYIGDTYDSLNPEHFTLLKAAKPVSKAVEIIEERNATYIVVNGKTTIAIPAGTPIGTASKHTDDTYIEEVGKAVAKYRLDEKRF